MIPVFSVIVVLECSLTGCPNTVLYFPVSYFCMNTKNDRCVITLLMNDRIFRGSTSSTDLITIKEIYNTGQILITEISYVSIIVRQDSKNEYLL